MLNKEEPSKQSLTLVPLVPKKRHGLTGRSRPQHVRDAISKAHKGKPKKYTSYLKGKKGPDHPAYKHGKGNRRNYDHQKQSAWIQGVKRQSGYKCFVTGISTDLQCHHLIGWSEKATRYEIANGVAIHKSIHSDFHNRYGRGGNTPAQFEEYCKQEHNITHFPWRQGDHKPIFTLLEEKALIKGFMETKSRSFVELVSSRNHQIVEGSYRTNASIFLIYCKTHNTDEKVIAGNYKRARFGVRCCSSKRQCSYKSPICTPVQIYDLQEGGKKVLLKQNLAPLGLRSKDGRLNEL